MYKLEDKSNNRGLTIEVMGGLGNQLFILSAGLNQAIRLQVPLILDVSGFGDGNSGVFELSLLLQHIDYPISLRTEKRSMLERIDRKVKILTNSGNYFVESQIDYEKTSNQICPGTTMSGYFQSRSNLTPEVTLLFLRAFRAVDKEYSSSTNDVHMHIRRGDYLNPKNSTVHGIVPITYFDAALDHLENINSGTSVKVFTDSPKLITAQELIRWNASLQANQPNISPLEVLISLSKTQTALVISNSTFSWWAAWLSQQRNPNTLVIAPRQWYVNEKIPEKLKFPSWKYL